MSSMLTSMMLPSSPMIRTSQPRERLITRAPESCTTPVLTWRICTKRAKQSYPANTRRVVRHSSPPTAPTIVQMVSARKETSDGYSVNSPAYFVPSLSPSTTPESGQRRPATWSLLDTTTQRRVPAASDRDESKINPNPTHDPNRG